MHISGCKFLLKNLIELPIVRYPGSVAQPAYETIAVVNDLLEALEQHKKQMNTRRLSTIRKIGGPEQLSNGAECCLSNMMTATSSTMISATRTKSLWGNTTQEEVKRLCASCRLRNLSFGTNVGIDLRSAVLHQAYRVTDWMMGVKSIFCDMHTFPSHTTS